jgi:hypothetical protein
MCQASNNSLFLSSPEKFLEIPSSAGKCLDFDGHKHFLTARQYAGSRNAMETPARKRFPAFHKRVHAVFAQLYNRSANVSETVIKQSPFMIAKFYVYLGIIASYCNSNYDGL